MIITPFTALNCPLDGKPLSRTRTSWHCDAGHNFDIASQGYTHLLPVQNKRSLDPGDSKAMVAARRRFLNAGFYEPIASATRRATLADLPAGAIASCLDAGCGEGYYLRQLAAGDEAATLRVLGLDISKWAVMAAAKQDKRPNWVVGSNANLPAPSASLDRILCLFGFPVYPEFARVLKPGGQLIQVDAGPDHLRELREIIYPSVRDEAHSPRTAAPRFALLSTEDIRFTIRLDSQELIADLLAMTPHLYRAKADGRARAAALSELTLTVDARLTRFVRDPDGQPGTLADRPERQTCIMRTSPSRLS